MLLLTLLALVCSLGCTLADHELRIHNNCRYKVWVGLLGNSIPDEGGYLLKKSKSRTSIVPNNWSGRVWGRTKCKKGVCQTGDCGRVVKCNGAGGIPPATLAEITFDAGSGGDQDFYDISLVDGYNIQMSMRPVSGTYKEGSGGSSYYCGRAGCDADLNRNCPADLQVKNDKKKKQTIACMSACTKFQLDEYCCRGAFNTPDKCPPFDYSIVFKEACPASYSYAYDDETSTFTCNGHRVGETAYDITFCG